MNLFFTGFTVTWGAFLLHSYRAISHLRSLDDFSGKSPSPLPEICVVLAVKDDESEIEETLEKLLSCSYQNFKILVINDRSTDQTPAILNKWSQKETRLKVAHINELPPGWLGKVHALHKGTASATGDFLLFMDADMGASDEILMKAASLMEEKKLDHLAILPNVEHKGFLTDLLMATSNILFTMSGRPWLSIENRPSSAVKGVGKFNLVRKSFFDKTEGFEWLKMEVADDVALGQLIAKNGGRSLFIKAGKGGPDLSWYPDFKSVVKGLEKNSVGGFTNYKWSIFLMMISVSACPFVIPLIALATGHFYAFIIPWFFSLLFAAKAKSVIRYPGKLLFFFPLGIFLLAGILVRSFLICRKNGGIRWSGTLYPISELKKGCRVKLGL